jgi:hypothetical protein
MLSQHPPLPFPPNRDVPLPPQQHSNRMIQMKLLLLLSQPQFVAVKSLIDEPPKFLFTVYLM